MRHPTEGVLRRLLDEPAAVPDPDRRHVVDCPRCLADLAAMREDAALVDAALAVDGTEVDVAAAWTRLSAGAPARARVAPPRAGRGRALLRRPAVAGLAVVVVLAGAGTAAANKWLLIFRTERVAAVGLSAADLVALPDLSSYGDLEVTGDNDLREVPDAATAAAESGLRVPEVTVFPRGVTGVPTYRVGGQVTATFTFRARRAAAMAADAGGTLPTPPPGLDGSRLRLVAGPGLLVTWRHQSGAPALAVGRAVAPTAFSSGVPFETARDYLLSIPGLPPQVAAQLRTFGGERSTLPIPVPAEQVATSTADVGGVPATVLASRDGTLAVVVWVSAGVVTAVAGALTADEVLSAARGLR